MNLIIKSISKRIKYAVHKAGGNKEIAKKSNIPISTIDYYIAGKSDYKLTKLHDIASACDVSLQWLISGDQASDKNSLDKGLINEAIIAIDKILIETNKEITPDRKPELVWAMYNLLKDKSETKSDNIINILKFIA
ncbi:MAG: hypothetical protein COB24_12910 [Hyphomicrobiales bacterium]|nr:MAG: hypothetical protein COB24_12910 [Hyphomicrobiales bacterium]